MPVVDTDTIEQAYDTWWHFFMSYKGDTPWGKWSKHGYEEFFKFIGQELTWDHWPQKFDLSEEAYARVNMLISPYHEVLLKAYVHREGLPWK